jgi:hypothetical protein
MMAEVEMKDGMGGREGSVSLDITGIEKGKIEDRY